MTQHDIDILQEFIQRELDLLCKIVDDSRAQASVGQDEIKQRLQSLEHGQTTIYQRITNLETHTEATAARDAGAEAERAAVRLHRGWVATLVVGAAAVTSTLSAIAFSVIDHLK